MKCAIIGLGRFGYQIATSLSDLGMEVLAIDSNESIIASIRDKVTQAICLRVTDEESLQTIGIEDMDTVVVAMGEDFAQSILITALLKKQLNIKNVVARAINKLHETILLLVGADRIVPGHVDGGVGSSAIGYGAHISSPVHKVIGGIGCSGEGYHRDMAIRTKFTLSR